MDERVRFVARLLDGEKMAALCEEFGISRKTGYKIYQRYQQVGARGLTDRTETAIREKHLRCVTYEAYAMLRQLTYTEIDRRNVDVRELPVQDVWGLRRRGSEVLNRGGARVVLPGEKLVRHIYGAEVLASQQLLDLRRQRLRAGFQFSGDNAVRRRSKALVRWTHLEFREQPCAFRLHVFRQEDRRPALPSTRQPFRLEQEAHQDTQSTHSFTALRSRLLGSLTVFSDRMTPTIASPRHGSPVAAASSSETAPRTVPAG